VFIDPGVKKTRIRHLEKNNITPGPGHPGKRGHGRKKRGILLRSVPGGVGLSVVLQGRGEKTKFAAYHPDQKTEKGGQEGTQQNPLGAGQHRAGISDRPRQEVGRSQKKGKTPTPSRQAGELGDRVKAEKNTSKAREDASQ